MTDHLHPTVRYPRIVALGVAALGLAVLAGGYGLGLGWLRQPLPEGAPMRPTTAVALLVYGAGLWLALGSSLPPAVRRGLQCAVGGVMAGAGLGMGGTIWVWAWPDAVLVADWRLSLPVGIGMLSGGAVLLLYLRPGLRTRGLRIAQWLALGPAIVALPMVVSLPLGFTHAREFATLARLAPHSALSLLALSFALFSARPLPGTPAGFVLGGTVAARVTRRLLLAGLLLPPAGALCEFIALRAGLDPVLHLGVFALLQVLVLSLLGGIVGWVLHRSEGARDRAERERTAALRQVERQAAILQSEVARRTSELSRTLVFNQRLALVASRTTNAVLICNASGAIEWVNEGFTRITGYGFEDALGHRPSGLLSGPGTDAVTVGRMQASMAAEQACAGEVLFYRKDGAEIWLATEVQPLRDPGGQLIGFMAIGSDITARREAEARMSAARDEAEQLNGQLEHAIGQARRAAAEANQANHAKSAFLATMSHEIRTPLNGILGMAALLRDTPLDETQQDFVRTIETSGDALLAIINDVLDYSKIEAGRIELERAPLDLRQCVEEVMELFAPKAAEKNLELVCRIAPEVPNAIIGDASRLRQILVNLVGNALKFTGEGQVIVALDAQRRDGSWGLHFAVRDSGIGIPADRIEKLFRPFYQGDSSTTRRFGGSGLGLAISRRLAEAMRGRLWVESEPDRGSVFHFSVTVAEEVLPERPAWQVSPALLAGWRVLVAVENGALRDLLTAQLAAWGALCGPAADPEALRKLAAGRSDWRLALVDRNFGHRAGWPGVGGVRTLPGCADLPVLLLAYPSSAPLPPSCAGRVIKPVRPAALFEQLRRMTAGVTPAEAEVAGALPPAPVPAAGPIRLLLVEDNPVNQRVALLMLSRLGYSAKLATQGEEAVTRCEFDDFDVVLMDMEMPVLDGCAATRRIRALTGRPQPWVVALTANALPADRERAFAAGMDDFVTKPIRLEDLAKALSRAAIRERNTAVSAV